MRITPVPHGLEDLIGNSGPRSGGLHMSAIYGDLYSDLEPDRYIRGSVPDPLRLEAGLAFESFLEEALKARLVNAQRPDELVFDEDGRAPILYNPDLIIFNGCTRVGEIKLTWLSTKDVPRTKSNNFPPKFDKYFTQMMSYCYCLDTPYARLIMFAVNGNYKPQSPELLAWDVEFSKRELKENWSMLMNHARFKGMR